MIGTMEAKGDKDTCGAKKWYLEVPHQRKGN